RAGLYLALVEERMGGDGLAVFRAIMVNGLMSIGGVREVLGVAQMGGAAKLKFNSVVAKLVRERFITAVTEQDTVTKVDRIMQLEDAEISKMTIPPTAKELLTIRRRIMEQEEEAYHSTTVVGIKRRASVDIEPAHSSKLLMSANGYGVAVDNSSFDAGQQQDHSNSQRPEAVDDELFFRAYYDRLDVFLRNQQIVNYFGDKYNAGAAAVAKCILRITEQHTRTCRVKVSNDIPSSAIFQHIPPDIPLADSVDTAGDMFFQRLGGANGAHVDGEASGGELSSEKRSEMLYALLEVVQADSSGIVARVDERGTGTYRVNFEHAATVLRDQCLDALVQEKFGSGHARFMRVLRDKQKLDEKVVSQATMLPIATCRERLHDLALAGMIDTVEIPRSADRNPSRMFYLWYVNFDKQTRSAMRFVFQGMSNVIARANKEVAARHLLIAKTKREDVIADQSLLTEAEHKELRILAKIKQRLAVANVRLDSMLLLINDISPQSADLKLLQ
ncbi:RNA polymerase III subunit C82, partial [Coemansia sp. RSA 2322]